jgi:hypothetical protein
MTLKEPKPNNPKIAASIQPDTFDALQKETEKTGNRSFIVDKSIRAYLGLDKKPELEKKAS